MKREERECKRCGEGRPPALGFHHLDEEEVELGVAKMVNYGYSRENR